VSFVSGGEKVVFVEDFINDFSHMILDNQVSECYGKRNPSTTQRQLAEDFVTI
jgi:hypothetical protein